MQGAARTDFGLLLAQAFNAYIEHLHRELAHRGFSDLRPAFGLALRALHERPRTLTALAGELGVTKQAAAKVVVELEGRSLIEREPSPEDGRATLLRLSPRGRSLVAAAIRIGDAVERDLGRNLGDDAAAHLRAALERLAYDPPWSDAPPARARRVW
jgi:DNA-binding MarR family transcriptional regulator